jgi:hypothetical protein
MDFIETDIIQETTDINEIIKVNAEETNNEKEIDSNLILQNESQKNLEFIELDEVKKQTTFITDDINKRVSCFLINELEKKIQYISELEDILKFQEQEILTLKNKLESVNKMELLFKIKNSINTKSEELSNKITLEENELEKETSEDVISINSKIDIIKSEEPKVVIGKANDLIKVRRRGMKL